MGISPEDRWCTTAHQCTSKTWDLRITRVQVQGGGWSRGVCRHTVAASWLWWILAPETVRPHSPARLVGRLCAKRPAFSFISLRFPERCSSSRQVRPVGQSALLPSVFACFRRLHRRVCFLEASDSRSIHRCHINDVWFLKASDLRSPSLPT